MISVNEPLLGERELEYVTECLRTGWISSAGHFIDDFEKAWAAYCGMKHGIAVSNGTTALQIAGSVSAAAMAVPRRRRAACRRARWLCGWVEPGGSAALRGGFAPEYGVGLMGGGKIASVPPAGLPPDVGREPCPPSTTSP